MSRLCPDCAKPLTPETYFGVTLDVCGMCGGMWFDQGELGRALHADAQALMRIDESVVPELHRNAEEETRRSCPACADPLSRFHYLYNSPIVLDACDRCGGFWVEDTELEKIQDWLADANARLHSVQRDHAEDALALTNYEIQHDRALRRTENLRGFITLLGRHRPFGRTLGF